MYCEATHKGNNSSVKEPVVNVLKLGINVDSSKATYWGEYSALIPFDNELEALKRICSINILEKPYENFDDDLILLSGLYDCLSGQKQIFFDNLKKNKM